MAMVSFVFTRRFPKKQGPLFRSPHSQNHSVLGSVVGPLVLETPVRTIECGPLK